MVGELAVTMWERPVESARGPVRIGALLPDVLARYAPPTQAAPSHNNSPRAASPIVEFNFEPASSITCALVG